MGHVRTYTSTTTTTAGTSPLLRALELIVGSVLLVLALPLIGVLALAVRRSSNGPVLHRERTRDRRGRPVEVLSFRTTIDGGNTTHHERLRAVVGASDRDTLTGVGRLMRATRTDRLPRLFSVIGGSAPLL